MKQLNPLTGLRGIAAYSVLIAHGISSSFLYDGVNLFQPFAARLAYFGMSLFFVLSGFVIHYNYAKLIKSKGIISGGYQFMVARFARLYPLYAMVILFSMDSIPSAIFAAHQWGALSYLSLTQSWFNFQTITFPPAWSISTEWFFYVAFLFLLPVLDRIRWPMATFVIFLIVTFLFLPNLIAYESSLNASLGGWIIYFSPFTRVFEFIAGSLASVLYLSNLDARRKIGILEFAVMLLCIGWCLAILVYHPLSTGKYSVLLSNFMFAPAIAPLLLLCCKYDTLLSRVLSSRPLMFVGEISYSVYLLGFLVMTAVSASFIWHRPSNMAYINSGIKITAIVTFTTFIAYGCYNLFEKPSRQWVRKLLTIRKRSEIVEPVPAS